jgi:hypothetical protein
LPHDAGSPRRCTSSSGWSTASLKR